MRAVVCVVIASFTTPARADDAEGTPSLELPTAAELAARDAERRGHEASAPLLTLDVIPRPNLVGLGVAQDTERTVISLGRRARITLSGTAWTGSAGAVPRDGVRDVDATLGTRAAIGLHYDAGWLQLDAELSENTLASRYGSGRYRDVSLTLSKSKRFSRWVTGWIALSIGHRQWEGEPPPGEEESATHIMLSIGGTFR